MTTEFFLLPKDEYNKLNSKLDKILSQLNLSEKDTGGVIGKKWVTEKKAQEITGKKGTTLWKMRNEGKLTYTKLNNRVYYDLESILFLLEENKTEAYNQMKKRSKSPL